MQKYFGSWAKHEDVEPSWVESKWNGKNYVYPTIEGFPTDGEILFASYGGASYEGDAFVLYARDGKLYEASGSHCSCFGLEGQWAPEETTVEALAMRDRPTKERYSYHFLSDHDNEAVETYWALVEWLPENLNAA